MYRPPELRANYDQEGKIGQTFTAKAFKSFCHISGAIKLFLFAFKALNCATNVHTTQKFKARLCLADRTALSSRAALDPSAT